MKIKVLLSYILLLAVLVSAGFYLYRRFTPILFPDGDPRAEIVERSMLISNTVSHLYQAEGWGTRFIQEPSDSIYVAYHQARAHVDVLLDSLKLLTVNQRQQTILLSVDSLLRLRDTNLLDIARRQKELNRFSNAEVGEKVERALPPLPTPSGTTKKADIAPLKPTVTIRDEIIYDTITSTIARPKKTFVDRLNNLFAPPKKDSIIEIRQIRRTITDTLVNILPDTPTTSSGANLSASRDTVISTMIKVLDDVEVKRQLQLKNIGDQIDQLLQTDKAINQTINRLLDELNQEWLNTSLSVIEERRQSLDQAGKGALTLVGVAFGIILLFTVLIFSDLNKSRKYRRALEKARIRAEELMQNREKLLLTITHDIKAPLSSLIGYLDLLKTPSGKSAQQQLDNYLPPMNRSAIQMMDLLSNLLEFYRLDAGKTTLNPAVTPLRRLLKETLDLFSPQAQRKGIALNLECAIPDDQCIRIDSLRLRQILQNLLSNAVKFTDHGSVRLDASLKSDSQSPIGTLLLQVTDTGIGIQEDMRQLIFEEFSRVEQPRKEGKEGVGLGLSIVRRLVTLFGGHITVDNPTHGGSVFSVKLPVELSEQKANPSVSIGAQPREESPEQSHVVRVLVVDDDPSQAALTCEMLHRLGHLCTSASSVPQAMELLEQLRMDLVLTDIQMPIDDGFRLLERIRKHPLQQVNDLPIVAVTANTQQGREAFLEQGFDDMLPKPFVTAQLSTLLTQPTLLKASPISIPVHMEDLVPLVEGDLAAFQQIVNVFYSSSLNGLQSMEAARTQDDWDAVRAIAHKMKPLWRQLRCPLAQTLHTIEQADKDENIDRLANEIILKGNSYLRFVEHVYLLEKV